MPDNNYFNTLTPGYQYNDLNKVIYGAPDRIKYDPIPKKDYMDMMLINDPQQIPEDKMFYRLREVWEWFTDFDLALSHCKTLSPREKNICWGNFDKARRKEPFNAIYASKFVTYLLPNKWKIRDDDRPRVIEGLLQLMILIVSNVEISEKSFNILAKTGIPVKSFPYPAVFRIIKSADPGFGTLLEHHLQAKSTALEYNFDAVTNDFYNKLVEKYTNLLKQKGGNEVVIFPGTETPNLGASWGLFIDYLNDLVRDPEGLWPLIKDPIQYTTTSTESTVTVRIPQAAFLKSPLLFWPLEQFFNQAFKTNNYFMFVDSTTTEPTMKDTPAIRVDKLFGQEFPDVVINFTKGGNRPIFGLDANNRIIQGNTLTLQSFGTSEVELGKQSVPGLWVQYQWNNFMDLYAKALTKRTGPNHWSKYQEFMNKNPLLTLATLFNVKMKSYDKIMDLIEKEQNKDPEYQYDLTETFKLADKPYKGSGGRGRGKGRSPQRKSKSHY